MSSINITRNVRIKSAAVTSPQLKVVSSMDAVSVLVTTLWLSESFVLEDKKGIGPKH